MSREDQSGLEANTARAQALAEFGQFYRGEIATWAKIVKESGVKIE